MPSYTNKLNLRKTDMATDGDDFFQFDVDLNENWDKVDDFADYEELNGVYFTKMKDVTIQIPGEGTEEINVDYYDVKEL